MATNRTFTMIKPDAFADGHTGSILSMIEKAGFRLIAGFMQCTRSVLFTTTFAST
jgi:nucleoside-diphosphate kinase